MKTKIIGISGRSGSGKNEVANYLQLKYGFFHFSIGSLIRNICKEKNLQVTRQNLVEISQSYNKINGECFFAQLAQREIDNFKYQKLSINSIRKLADYQYLQSFYGYNFTLIFLDIDESIRFERILKRKTEEIDSFSEYQKASLIEEKAFDYSELNKVATVVINNNDSIDKLYKNIDVFFSTTDLIL